METPKISDTFVDEKNVFAYYPKSIQNVSFDDVYNETESLYERSIITIYGKDTPIPRLNLFLTENPDRTNYGYSGADMKNVDMEECPSIGKIKKLCERKLKTKFNACLVNLYRDGNDYIGWHSDKEAISKLKLSTHVASVSLGATRIFRFREIPDTSGWKYEFNLGSGDLVHMYENEQGINCQKVYKHTVPKESTVKSQRINLTFRWFPEIK